MWCIVSRKEGLRVYESSVHAEPVTELRLVLASSPHAGHQSALALHPRTPRYANIVIHKLFSLSLSLLRRTADVCAPLC